MVVVLASLPTPFVVDVSAGAGGAVSIRVAGELDVATAPELGEALRRQAALGRDVVLDLAGVEFIDSTGVVVVWQAIAEAKMRGCELSIRDALPPSVRRIMDLTALLPELPLVAA